jgi:arylsulfatase A-like enzyme
MNSSGVRPNLLFIMTDHQRADSLGMVQSGSEVTPNLNQLAGAGTCFTRAYNTCPLCVPARTALATGKYPTKNGVVFNDWRGVRAGDHFPLHQLLFEAGYEVGHIGVDHIRVAPSLRDRVSFSTWIDSRDYDTFLADLGIDRSAQDLSGFRREIIENQAGQRVSVHYSNTETAVWPYPDEYFLDAYYCQQAVDFLAQSRSGPFALFLYLWAPHPPLRVPEPYASLFNPADIVLPANVGIQAEGEPSGRRRGIAAQLAEGITEEGWRRVWAAHLGLVNLADAGIGRVLSALDATGVRGRTVVCFTTDHGEHLGQHAMYQKMEMYEPAIRVPLVIKGPGICSQLVALPVSHLDVMPTVLEILELPVPAGLDGRSLIETLTLGKLLEEERPVFSQYSGNPTLGDIRRAVITQRYKAVFDPADCPELYDLKNDPLEMHNLAEQKAYAGVLDELQHTCRTWAREHNDWVNI